MLRKTMVPFSLIYRIVSTMHETHTTSEPNTSSQKTASAQPHLSSSDNSEHSRYVPPSKRPSGSRLREALSSIGFLAIALLIGLFLAIFIFQSYKVDGPSMETTLHQNDRLIVWKLPRTWSRLTRHQYIPKRGDIIVVNQSGLLSFGDANDTKQLIKRVIGLPGERIVIKDGRITVYNSQHPEGFDPDKTLGYGKEVAIPETNNNIDVELGSSQIFICGDNRSNSLDSRAFGPIESSQIVGKLVARIAPLDKIKRF